MGSIHAATRIYESDNEGINTFLAAADEKTKDRQRRRRRVKAEGSVPRQQ